MSDSFEEFKRRAAADGSKAQSLMERERQAQVQMDKQIQRWETVLKPTICAVISQLNEIRTSSGATPVFAAEYPEETRIGALRMAAVSYLGRKAIIGVCLDFNGTVSITADFNPPSKMQPLVDDENRLFSEEWLRLHICDIVQAIETRSFHHLRRA